MASLGSLFVRFSRDQRGTSGLEFAMVAPFLIVLVFGGFTVFDHLRVSAKGDKATSVVADMISRRATVDDSFLQKMQGIYDHTAATAANGFRVSSFQFDGQRWSLRWSSGSGGLGRRAATDIPKSILPIVAKNESVILVEVDYDWRPFTKLIPSLGSRYEHFAVERPRYVAEIERT